MPDKKPGVYITNLFIYAKYLARMTDHVLEPNQEGGVLGMFRSNNKTSKDTKELISLIGNHLRDQAINPDTISSVLNKQLSQRFFSESTGAHKGVLLVPDETNIIFLDRNNTPDLVLKLLYQMIFASPILKHPRSNIIDSKISTSYKEKMFDTFERVIPDIYNLLMSNKIAQLGNEKLYKYSKKIYNDIKGKRGSIQLQNSSQENYIKPSILKDKLQPEFDKLLKEKALLTIL